MFKHLNKGISTPIAIAIILLLAVSVGAIALWQYSEMQKEEIKPAPENNLELNEQEQSCIDSGGEISISSCCKTTDDFPNLCLIGPCGCSPDNSQKIKVCDCGSGKCFDGNKCVFLDEISAFLEELKTETKLDFSEIETVEFSWRGDAEEVIQGKGFRENVSADTYESINLFFEDQGFQIDGKNMADGVRGSLYGYKKDQTVCTLRTEHKMVEGQWQPNTEVKCGKLNAIFETFIPKDWHLIEKAEGDLNQDGLSDLAAVIQYKGHISSEAPVRRLLIALQKDNGSYELLIQSDKAILKADQGGVWGDPFNSDDGAGLAIDRGSLLIKFYGGSNWRWSKDYRFRYQDNGWYLIGATFTDYHTASYEETAITKDYNSMTGQLKTTDKEEIKWTYNGERELLSLEDFNADLFNEEEFFKAIVLVNLRDFKEMESGKINIGGISVEKIDLFSLEDKTCRNEEEGFIITFKVNEKVRVEMYGGQEQGCPEDTNSYYLYSFTVFNGNEVVTSKMVEFEGMTHAGGVQSFNYNNKTYILVSGGMYGNKAGYSEFFLYVIDKNGDIKPVKSSWGGEFSWGCDNHRAHRCSINYGIGYNNNLYLYTDREIWNFGENDVFRDKIYANSMIAENRKLYFRSSDNFCYDFTYSGEYYLDWPYWGAYEPEEIFSPVKAKGCADEYFFTDSQGKFVEANSEFKKEYLKKASESDEIIEEESWQVLRWLPFPDVIFPMACIAEGMKILMADGSYKYIEEIGKGDEVISFDFKNKKNSISKIDEYIEREDPIMIINDTLRISPDQPVFINEEFKEGKDVKVGDFLLNEKGEKIIVDTVVFSTQPDETTFDLGLDKYRNFYVDGILVQGLLPMEDGWLPKLLDRTLNYIFAGEEEKAWSSFDEDFARLAVKYPIKDLDETDAHKIRENMERALMQKEKKIGYLGVCGVSIKKDRIPSQIKLPEDLKDLDYGELVIDEEFNKEINPFSLWLGGPGLPDSCVEKGVIPNSPADRAGIRGGDIIIEANGKLLVDGKLEEILAKSNTGDEIILKIIKDGKIIIESIKLVEKPKDL